MKNQIKIMALFCAISLGLCAKSEPQIDIFTAIKIGNVKVVKKWLKINPDLDIKAQEGQGLLHCAVQNKQRKIVKMLLKAGVMVNDVDKNQKTALDYAVEANLGKIVCDLYKADGQVTTTQNLYYLKSLLKDHAFSLGMQFFINWFFTGFLAAGVIGFVCAVYTYMPIGFLILVTVPFFTTLLIGSIAYTGYQLSLPCRAYSWSKAAQNLDLYCPENTVTA